MQLRQRLALYPETLSDFGVAAEEKYWEGIELAAAGHNAAGIYLLGFTAEMLLKIACFRNDGALVTSPVSPLLVPARTWLNATPMSVPHESYHSLWFWMTYLQARRIHQRRPLARNLDGELVHHVRRLYQVWWIEMRYRPDQATAHEVNRVVTDVTWLRENFLFLWR